MLDTDVCVDVLRHRSAVAKRRLERAVPCDVFISSIVAAELWTGAAKSSHFKHAAEALREFLVFVTVLDWPAQAAVTYGRIRAQPESAGNPIGAMDTLIAAHTIHEGAILVTHNLGEFARVPGLRLASWSAGSDPGRLTIASGRARSRIARRR